MSKSTEDYELDLIAEVSNLPMKDAQGIYGFIFKKIAELQKKLNDHEDLPPSDVHTPEWTREDIETQFQLEDEELRQVKNLIEVEKKAEQLPNLRRKQP